MVAKLRVTVYIGDALVEDKVVIVKNHVRLGESIEAVVSFPGGDLIVNRVGDDLVWRGRRLAVGQCATYSNGDVAVIGENMDMERAIRPSVFRHVDPVFFLVLLGMVSMGMWVDTFEKAKSSLDMTVDFVLDSNLEERVGESSRLGLNSQRSAAVQPVLESIQPQSVEVLWEGPRAQNDDLSTRVEWYSWYRSFSPLQVEEGSGIEGEASRQDRARWAYEMDRFETAMVDYQWLIAHQPHNVEWLAGLALCQKRLGMHSLERLTWERLLELEPENLIAMTNLPVNLARLGLFEMGARAMTEMLNVHENHPMAALTRGVWYARVGAELPSLRALNEAMSGIHTLPSGLQHELRADFAIEPILSPLRSGSKLVSIVAQQTGEAPYPLR